MVECVGPGAPPVLPLPPDLLLHLLPLQARFGCPANACRKFSGYYGNGSVPDHIDNGNALPDSMSGIVPSRAGVNQLAGVAKPNATSALVQPVDDMYEGQSLDGLVLGE